MNPNLYTIDREHFRTVSEILSVRRVERALINHQDDIGIKRTSVRP